MVLVVDLGQPEPSGKTKPFIYDAAWDFTEGAYAEDVVFNFVVPPGKTYRIRMMIVLDDLAGG